MINSEFGNVWGYEGSTGDVDWSWDYHRAVDAFRRHPEARRLALHRAPRRHQRVERLLALRPLVEGDGIRRARRRDDAARPARAALRRRRRSGAEHDRARPASASSVPLYASFLSGSARTATRSSLRAELYGWNTLGERRTYATVTRRVAVPAVDVGSRSRRSPVTMPDEPAVAVLAVRLEDAAGTVLQRNFTTFVVEGDAPATATLADGARVRVARVPAARQRRALVAQAVERARRPQGRRRGLGFFEYRIPWPAGLAAADVASATFLVEASAKRLYRQGPRHDRRRRTATTCAAAASTTRAATRTATR